MKTRPESRKPIRKRRGRLRRGPMRDAKYLAFLSEEGHCVACAQRYPALKALNPAVAPLLSVIDPAHGPVNGMRSKGPDDGAVPLCRYHHNEQHRLTWPNFEIKYHFSREFQARIWWNLYLTWKNGGRTWNLPKSTL